MALRPAAEEMGSKWSLRAVTDVTSDSSVGACIIISIPHLQIPGKVTIGGQNNNKQDSCLIYFLGLGSLGGGFRLVFVMIMSLVGPLVSYTYPHHLYPFICLES